MMMKQLSCQNPSSAFSLAADELWPLPISATPNPDAADKSNSTLTRQSSCCTPNSQLLHSSTLTHFNDANAKRIKASGEGAPREESDDSKAEVETNSQTGDQLQDTKPDQPKDCIHVRAIRGQATDSLSLAERTRREKISERMKILQDLVPGGNKVIGKAQVLDESINYIRSLQHQVEFLSMKLKAVNSRMNPGIEGFPSKDLAAPPFDATEMIFGQQAPREYAQVAQHERVHMQVRSKL